MAVLPTIYSEEERVALIERRNCCKHKAKKCFGRIVERILEESPRFNYIASISLIMIGTLSCVAITALDNSGLKPAEDKKIAMLLSYTFVGILASMNLITGIFILTINCCRSSLGSSERFQLNSVIS